MKNRTLILIAVLLIVLPPLSKYIGAYGFSSPLAERDIPAPAYETYLAELPPTPSGVALALPQPEYGGKVILLDAAHVNQYEQSELEPFITAISALGGRVEFVPDEASLFFMLKYASAYVSFSPSMPFTSLEAQELQKFVGSGGRLLLFADPTRVFYGYDFFTGNYISLPDVNYLNPLLAPHGMAILNDYLYNLQENEGNFRNVQFTRFAANPLTENLNMVVFYGAHSVKVSQGAALLEADENTLSSLTDSGSSLTALGLSANGQVLAAGDFSFLTNPYAQVADNAQLLNALAAFAVQAERLPSLQNFPYLFQGAVNLSVGGETALQPAMLEPISRLQAVLSAVNVPLQIRATPTRNANLILLGTYEPTDTLAPYLSRFGVNLDAPDYVEIRGYGTVEKNGAALLLLEQTGQTSTLLLLAPTTQDLPELIDILASGSLGNCIVQENIGVCALYGSSDYYYEEEYEEEYYYEEEPTPTPEPTPTAAG